jgi:hypothetical protein
VAQPGCSRVKVASVVAGGGALALLLFVDPATSAVFPPCLFRLATGWQCPGCGSARAIHELLHGDVYAAMALNPFAVSVAPVAAFDYSAWMMGRGRAWAGSLRPAAIYALAAALVAFAVVRNLG